ncbi:MAG: YceI family protein [Acidimicrobiia bacterium]
MSQPARDALPAPGDWSVDVSHTEVGFSVRHLGLAKVRGRFRAFDGVVRVADRPEDSSVEVTVDAASIDSRDEARDAHLRSADFLDVESFPALTFRSTRVRPGGRGWLVDGDLTIRGVTRPVVLDAAFEGIGGDPWGGRRAAFSASTEIDREDWGLTWNAALESGGFLVGKKVRIELEVELVALAADGDVAADDGGVEKVA